MFKLILKLMFTADKKEKLIRNRQGQNVLYVVGTPGLGKSIKFMAAKILLDFRIRHIIKSG